MKGSFWNSDGFKDPAKHAPVHESIRDFKLDWFAILENARDGGALEGPMSIKHGRLGVDILVIDNKG
jgi:hypothetical protein